MNKGGTTRFRPLDEISFLLRGADMEKGHLEFPDYHHEESMKALIQAMKDDHNPFGVNGAVLLKAVQVIRNGFQEKRRII